MDNEIYEVDRDEYRTFIGQLNHEKTHVEESWREEFHIVNIIGDISKQPLCSRVSDSELEEEHYFIYNYPNKEEYVPPKPVMRINLDTREEVQAFLNALAKIQKENKND